jgi:hypothetical protein
MAFFSAMAMVPRANANTKTLRIFKMLIEPPPE